MRALGTCATARAYARGAPADAAAPRAAPAPGGQVALIRMLSGVAKRLSRRLGLLDEDLEFALCDHVAENLRPASNQLTHKGEFAEFLPTHQARTVRLLPGKAAALDESLSEAGCEKGVWFLKKIGTGLSTGVTVHESLAAATAAAETARGEQCNSWYTDGVHLGAESRMKAEYVIQQAVRSPRLWNGRKNHFRLYLLAVSPPAPSGASRLRAAMGLPQQPESEQLTSAEQLQTRWYLNEHIWLAAAPGEWLAPSSTDRASQISATRTAELRNFDHDLLWPVLRTYAERFVADARVCVQRDRLTPRQQECLGLELFGLDVIVSEDMSCTALEVNSGPRQCTDEEEMQYSMYEIALGLERTPVDEGMRWLELQATDESAFASPCTGKVAAWAGTARYVEPAPSPAARATDGTASVRAKTSAQKVSASAPPCAPMPSCTAGSSGEGTMQRMPARSDPAIDAFMHSMPNFI